MCQVSKLRDLICQFSKLMSQGYFLPSFIYQRTLNVNFPVFKYPGVFYVNFETRRTSFANYANIVCFSIVFNPFAFEIHKNTFSMIFVTFIWSFVCFWSFLWV
jgi:hypothetical protein